jgi:hypothetical protein
MHEALDAIAIAVCLTLASLAAVSTPAHGQDIQVYRCGNAFSDSPCGAGQVVVDVRPSTIQTTPGAWQSVTFGGPTLYVVPPWFGGGAAWRTHDGLPWYGSGQAWSGQRSHGRGQLQRRR